MKIGIDLDNTIISYEHAFHEVALSMGWVTEEVPRTKNHVKNYMHERGCEVEFTILQGLVYGRYIHSAEIYDGVSEFFEWALSRELQVNILSHKSQYPIRGEKVNLRLSAKNFLEEHNFFNFNNFSEQNLHFFDTKEEKIRGIKKFGFDVFVDDLSSILLHPHFPVNVMRIHFSKLPECPDTIGFKSFGCWFSIKKYLNSKLI